MLQSCKTLRKCQHVTELSSVSRFLSIDILIFMFQILPRPRGSHAQIIHLAPCSFCEENMHLHSSKHVQSNPSTGHHYFTLKTELRVKLSVVHNFTY